MRQVRLTGRGRGVVLSGCALLLIGWTTDIPVALAAGVFALAVSGSALGWVAVRRHSVLIGRKAPPETSAVGRPLPTTAAIAVRPPGYGPALLRNLIPAEDSPGPGPDQGPGDAVVRLDRAEVLVERAWVPRRRGVLRWPELGVELSDPLGIAAGTRQAAPSGRTVVFPQTVPLGRWLPGVAAGDSELDRRPGSRRGPGDPGPVPRAHQAGDELRRMHWPATARAGRPMVRTEEPRAPHAAVIAIDCSQAGYRDPEAFERAITACASISEALLDQGWSIQVRTVRGRPLTDPPWVLGPQGHHLLLAALAVLQLDPPGADVPPSPAGFDDAAIVIHGAHSRAGHQPAIRLGTEASGADGQPGRLIWDGSAPLASVWAAASSQGALR